MFEQAVAATEMGVSLDRIAQRAASSDMGRRVLEVLERLEADVYLEETKKQLRDSLAAARPYWDLCCALAACAELLRPERYLEIGVRRGRSACVVASVKPDVDLYLFDMWAADYAGVPNPGPQFVRRELAKVGHRGNVQFVTGRSQETIPAFVRDSARGLRFPLLTVDGDHRDERARTDLDNVLPILAPAGVVVFDDIAHPGYPTLGATWRSWARAHGLVVAENTRDATGTALATNVLDCRIGRIRWTRPILHPRAGTLGFARELKCFVGSQRFRESGAAKVIAAGGFPNYNGTAFQSDRGYCGYFEPTVERAGIGKYFTKHLIGADHHGKLPCE